MCLFSPDASFLNSSLQSGTIVSLLGTSTFEIIETISGVRATTHLRHTSHEPFQASKHLPSVHRVQDVHLRLPGEPLNAQQAVATQVRAQPLLHLPQHQAPEPLVLPRRRLEDGVDEPGLPQLRGADPLAHEQRLVGPGGPEPLDQRPGGAPLGDEAEGAEGREEEGVRGAVDEVRVRDQGGGEPDHRPVQSDDEDLGVRVEGLCDVQVEGDKGAKPPAAVGLAIVTNT